LRFLPVIGCGAWNAGFALISNVSFCRCHDVISSVDVNATDGHEDVMDRRSFFKSVTNKVGRTVVRVADSQANKSASHWIRPPYALQELDFILACTRCDQCIDACPHKVIFKLPARLGVRVAGTPALDLLNRGCHICDDWPCVTACEADALHIPEKTEDQAQVLPVIARVEINSDTCLPYSGPECGACEASCPVPGALKWDMTKPYIDPELCTGCALCREICIVDPSAVMVYSPYQPQENQPNPIE
jgi:ferredoxin-type protein NapG